MFLFQISKDEKYMFCTCGSRVNVLEISTGKIVHSVEHVSSRLDIFAYGELENNNHKDLKMSFFPGYVLCVLQEDQEDITSFALSCDDNVSSEHVLVICVPICCVCTQYLSSLTDADNS